MRTKIRFLVGSVIAIAAMAVIAGLAWNSINSPKNHDTSLPKVTIHGDKVTVPATKVEIVGDTHTVDAPQITISRQEIEEARKNMISAGLESQAKKLTVKQIARLIQRANVTSLDATSQYKADKGIK